MKTVFITLLTLVIFTSCAESSTNGSSAKVSRKYTPLTLEQSKKLITPTIYSIPTYNIDSMSCASSRKMKDSAGKVLFSVCKEVYADCEMEGTCQIQHNSKKYLVNVDTVIQGERRFVLISDSECVYGKGARSDRVHGYKTMCLDPYRSVAADLHIYNLGDVIYIPSAVGMKLPDGSIHDGYFVVRDSGGAIKGNGRFDFFSGLKSASSSENPLGQLGFGDRETNVPYFVAKGSEADNVLKKRNFPSLPVK